ncbi:hypothetical protein [Sodalis-like endosymbiont of Proechinophthirus fluctus]|uniref:hypothetical protein n=1 Tax=Sodalis-like endosymbiont of Proechinophthirus fluctus TaxID=1462730 RepID=UPI00164F0FCF|nr:hypothetical protein [Sodalis-like endosymbiont of Proechinophthirus fluctus]
MRATGCFGTILTLLSNERKMQCTLQQVLVENDRKRLHHVDPTYTLLISRSCHAK